MKQRYGEEIKQFILENVDDYPSKISKVASEKFQVSRNAIAKHLRALMKEGLLVAKGRTKDREYSLALSVDETFSIPVTAQLEEHIVWHDRVLPFLKDLPKNILAICEFGITEMINNVIDHSESPILLVEIQQDFSKVYLAVQDKGIGIFQKLQNDFNINDPRQALLELTKGKLTSDTTKHTGEGIFFTSRMFSKFCISSDGYYFDKYKEGDEWFYDFRSQEVIKGTMVLMTIEKTAKHTIKEIFDAHTSDFNEFGFTKTTVPLELLRYEGDTLISRSQAKRLMARVESFKEVILDFKDINFIGQAFADEIFRVWTNRHPETKIIVAHANKDVQQMIKRVQSNLVGNFSLVSLAKETNKGSSG
jgi:anti-sigma regulatory factor (Ser/Thr protein kinase)